MNSDSVTWGVDFWQKVLISGLGTVGAFLVAMVVFMLTRFFDRRRLQHAQTAKILEECSEQIGELIGSLMHIPSDIKAYMDMKVEVTRWATKSTRYLMVLAKYYDDMQNYSDVQDYLGAWVKQHPPFVGESEVLSKKALLQELTDAQLLLIGLQADINKLAFIETYGRRRARRYKNISFINAQQAVDSRGTASS